MSVAREPGTNSHSIRVNKALIAALKKRPINMSATVSMAIYEASENKISIFDALKARPETTWHKGEFTTTSFSLKQSTIDELKKICDKYGLVENLVLSLIVEAYLLAHAKMKPEEEQA